MGRATQGVSLISLDPGTKLAGIEKIAETEDENGNGNGTNGDGANEDPPRGGGEGG
jgi:DNA gyrase subunit A